jgi:hypothetical protein
LHPAGSVRVFNAFRILVWSSVKSILLIDPWAW